MAARRNAATEKKHGRAGGLIPAVLPGRGKGVFPAQRRHLQTHLIRLLFEYGYTDGIYKELYRELFGAGRGRVLHDPAYEPVQAVLELARGTGGVVVLAHPSVYSSMELAAQLAAQGAIDGVEIDHPRNTPQDKAAFARAGAAVWADCDRRHRFSRHAHVKAHAAGRHDNPGRDAGAHRGAGTKAAAARRRAKGLRRGGSRCGLMHNC